MMVNYVSITTHALDLCLACGKCAAASLTRVRGLSLCLCFKEAQRGWALLEDARAAGAWSTVRVTC